MNNKLRPLPLAEEIIKSAGLEMTYPYDDLVFVESNAFLLRFNDINSEEIFIHFNTECKEEEKPKLIKMMKNKALKMGLKMILAPNYTTKQKEGFDEFQIIFNNQYNLL